MRRIVQYHQRLLELDPIALWLQDEKVGGTSYDWVRRNQGGDQDGAYTGVTLARPGIGDGRTSPLFDGANDFNDIDTPTLRATFDGGEGTCFAWARVFNSGVWIDGTRRTIMRFRTGVNDYVRLIKTVNNNELEGEYKAGAPIQTRTISTNTTSWFSIAITWSATADEVRVYFNGVQEGATLNGLGVWGGVFTSMSIGDWNAGPAFIWYGYIAYGIIWNRALPSAEIASLYTESF